MPILEHIIEDLNDYGRARLEDDYAQRDRFTIARGRRCDHRDFATGWLSLAVRHKLWSYFTKEARARLESSE